MSNVHAPTYLNCSPVALCTPIKSDRLFQYLPSHSSRTTKETMQPNNKRPRKTLLFGSFISFVMTVPTGRPYFYFPNRKAMHKPSGIYWTKELLLINRTRMGEQVK